VCQNYQPPAGYIPQMINPMVDDIKLLAEDTGSQVNRAIVPFVFCGDLRGYDSDMSYSLLSDLNDDEYEYREVVQKPIDPAYKEVLELTKSISLKNLSIKLDNELEQE